MSVRAKFRCNSIEDFGNDMVTVKLSAVSSGDDNKSWSKWTPSGTLSLTITNPEAFNQFKVGKEYFLDFNEVVAVEKAA